MQVVRFMGGVIILRLRRHRVKGNNRVAPTPLFFLRERQGWEIVTVQRSLQRVGFWHMRCKFWIYYRRLSDHLEWLMRSCVFALGQCYRVG